jgi:hypothetical protein
MIKNVDVCGTYAKITTTAGAAAHEHRESTSPSELH